MKSTLLLIVDLKQTYAKQLTGLLDQHYEIIHAVDENHAIKIVEKKSISIILSAGIGCNQLTQLFRFLKKHKDEQMIPVIVIANQLEEVCVLKLGAWEFVSMPYHDQALLLKIKNAIERSQLSAYRQLKYLSEYDSLTGIYNKNKFFQATRQMIDRESNQLFAFIRFDIDRFQLVNSFFGTDEGDQLLCYIAEKIRLYGLQQPYCTYGRMESDIFCLCLPYDTFIQTNLIEMIRNSFYEYNSDYDIVPSVGIYLIKDRTLSIESMYDYSTLAAKHCKGNYVKCYAYYNESMSALLAREQEVINEMNHALENHQFIIYLQPKIDIQSSKPCGAEALTRWNHPKRGIMAPNEFIGIFEQNGFITKLDFYIWEQVCILLRKWLDMGYQPYPISVNISRVDLYNPRLVDMIIELVRKYQIIPDLLNLELTESAYADNPIMLTETIERLQKKGFTVMMDDFGSGYSSLNILKDMDVDLLKIDMRFLSKTKIAGRGETIIASVIRMSKWLNIPVIAEGVETMDQVEFLRSVGCDYVQGYFYEKPIPVEQYEKKYLSLGEFVSYCNDNYRLNKHIYDELFLNDPLIKQLFSSSNEAALIFEYNNDNIELIRVNAAYYTMMGYKDQALKTLDLLQLIAEEDRSIFIDAFKRVINDGSSQEFDYRVQKFNGSYVKVRLNLKFTVQMSDKYILIGIIHLV